MNSKAVNMSAGGGCSGSKLDKLSAVVFGFIGETRYEVP